MFLLSDRYWTVKDTPSKGKGVFAKEDIPAGTVIGDYLGTFIKADYEEQFEEKHGFYSMYYTDYSTIFPDVTTAGIHLLNHSCAPNCGMYTYKGHTLYFSLRKIFAGEELSVSYQLSPLDKDCDPCTHQCYCQSRVCRGTMHLPKDLYDKWDHFDTTLDKATQKSRAQIGKNVPLLSDYPERISDYSIYHLFGAEHQPPIDYPDAELPSISEIRQRIRETGRCVHFPKLNTTVYGIIDNQLITTA